MNLFMRLLCLLCCLDKQTFGETDSAGRRYLGTFLWLSLGICAGKSDNSLLDYSWPALLAACYMHCAQMVRIQVGSENPCFPSGGLSACAHGPGE